MPYSLSVKELANYVYSSGDLNASSASFEHEKIGQEIHEWRQGKCPNTSQKEVFIQRDIEYLNEIFTLTGRIDLVHHQETLVLEEIKWIDLVHHQETLVLEEIKSTLVDLSQIHEDTYKAHSLQLKIYGYLWALI